MTTLRAVQVAAELAKEMKRRDQAAAAVNQPVMAVEIRHSKPCLSLVRVLPFWTK